MKMELLKTSIQKTIFEYIVFVETDKGLLKYTVVVELYGTLQNVSIYKEHGIKLTNAEKRGVKAFITKQFKIT